MEMGIVVGIATGSVAFSSLIVLVMVFFIRRRRETKIERSLGTQMFYVPPAVKVVSDEDLEAQQDPPVQEVASRRPQMSHSPTLKSIKPATRTRSMSVESQIVSPLSQSSTNANTTSLSRTSTITNNNATQYKAYKPPSLSAPETPLLAYIPSSPIAPEVPRLPDSLIPGSRITPPPNGWMPESPTTYDPPSRKVSPLSFASQSGSIPGRLSPIQHTPPSRQVSPLPSIARPTISRRSTTDATAISSLYSIAEKPVVYTPKSRYYSAHNTSRQSLIHIEGTQNALPELPGCEPVVMKKHHSWHSMRG
ncbi:hypothetical protein Slin15195_G118590 [Septoria linicola]|uniref:Uncharacterized protein n=1 Tax=Septoria linicola TaxID=215465 RepID=A0A9Q9B5D0_9PEZI|nr:hypothetical protein Slin14017_G095580 [Septoria linicola]USW58540.1 hypothetical protein Slin15195_G118590 [Septoria linicola]